MPTPRSTASRMNAMFSGVFVRRFVPSPIREASVSPILNVVLFIALDLPDIRSAFASPTRVPGSEPTSDLGSEGGRLRSVGEHRYPETLWAAEEHSARDPGRAEPVVQAVERGVDRRRAPLVDRQRQLD